ncbi:MAG: TusE/DsrC/DsvC family sulfur relay protein [Candidatus Paceibacterota bacterium]|jgi:tRNA 2-thiouridine synthesizing protein E
MGTIDFQGKQIEVDDEGYLLNLYDWTADLATLMAKQDNIDLTPDHWEIINFLREYYEVRKTVPLFSSIIRRTIKALGPEKGNTRYLYKLYPKGPVKQSCKYAGLQKPSGCM